MLINSNKNNNHNNNNNYNNKYDDGDLTDFAEIL